ncbi:MAG: Tim44 domain-containing protein, partial [Gammaproteobacteria bacterium]
SLSQPARSASQQQAYNKNQAARQNLANRGGLMGLLGGLALGGLLGALFFGGAFEGFNFMDFVVFAGIAFLLYKLFAAKAGNAQRPAYGGNSSNNPHYRESAETPYNAYDRSDSSANADFDTDILFDKNKKAQGAGAQTSFQDDADFNSAEIPAGFDAQAFLSGAKAAFKALQAAWDQRDLAEIRGLTTDKVFAEIQDQLQGSDTANRTEVLTIDAQLLDVRDVGNELEAVVLFDTVMREDIHEQAHQVREVWHFIKPKNSLQPTWYLDGIQQLED